MHIGAFYGDMLINYLNSFCKTFESCLLHLPSIIQSFFLSPTVLLENSFFGLMLWIIKVAVVQALFVFLLLPFLSNLKGIPFGSLLPYLRDGAGCFFNTGAKISG